MEKIDPDMKRDITLLHLPQSPYGITGNYPHPTHIWWYLGDTGIRLYGVYMGLEGLNN